MKKIRLAFYKAQWGKWTDLVISGWTWIWNPFTKPYSHVEIGFVIQDQWMYFSSCARKNQGTRWISADKLFKHSERWDIEEIVFSEERIEMMIKRAKDISGKKYDWLGIMGFATLTGRLNSKNRWYCSEAIWYVLMGIWRRRISPRRLSRKIFQNFT